MSPETEFSCMTPVCTEKGGAPDCVWVILNTCYNLVVRFVVRSLCVRWLCIERGDDNTAGNEKGQVVCYLHVLAAFPHRNQDFMPHST